MRQTQQAPLVVRDVERAAFFSGVRGEGNRREKGGKPEQPDKDDDRFFDDDASHPLYARARSPGDTFR